MKTAVIGVGAIGGLFLGYLKERNIDVTGVARDYQIASLLEEGILIDGIRGSKVIGDLNVSPRLSEKVDLAVFATKTQNLEEAIRSNLDYLKDAYVLSTQNGVYAEHLLNKYFDTRRIVSGIVMFGATFFSPNKVTHNFDGKLILGSVFNEGIETADKLGAFLSLVFDVCVAENIKGKKYLKLFVNLNNCIAGCLGGSIQEVFSDIDVCAVAVSIIAEAYKVINAGSIVLEDLPTYPAQRVHDLANMPRSEATSLFSKIMTSLSKDPLYGSILQSIRRQKKSEIDYINGEVVKVAKENNIEAPVNEAIVKMVHEVEDTGRFFDKQEFLKTINI